MGGGLMQLVAYGAQDVYLTGNPQITFWKVVYRRHTNFSMEAVEHTLNGNPDFGRSSTVTILRNGDLAGRICLKVELKAVDLRRNLGGINYDTFKIAYIRRLGHALIKEVEVEIGGSRIDRHYGVWMDVWYELTHTESKERGYRAMIGDVESLTKLSNYLPTYTLYIPLQFWFNRHPGLALPLIALQYHEVRLNFEFENIKNLVVYTGVNNSSVQYTSFVPDYSQFGMSNASILVDYIYLDSEERRRFAQVGHEYLIEQLQHTGVESITSINTKLKLGFNHPCKEIIWALRNGAFNGSNLKKGGNRFLAYTHDDKKWDEELQKAADNLASGMIYFNNAPNIPSDEYQQINFTDKKITCHIINWGNFSTKVTIDAILNTYDTSIYIIKNALSGLNNSKCNIKELGCNKIQEISIDYTIYGPSVKADLYTLTMADISVPISAFANDYRVTTNNLNPTDTSVVQLNYGLQLDGKGNPVEMANIQLNGHDRFDPMDGNYFNYVQPDAHHTRTPADGINVYSFALNPEQHQPSGTANLSRIDNTQLNITFGDSIRTENDICLDLFSGSLFYVWAVNYNVLRVMSGMAGLAYAN